MVILFEKHSSSITEVLHPAGNTLLEIIKGFSARPIREYRIGKRNIEVTDRSRARTKAIRLGDWRKTIGEEFTGDVEYTVAFTCPKDVAEQARILDLGGVSCACEASLNGRSLGRRIWKPFAFPVEGALREGKNELKITVTNTLANQYATTKNLDRWPTNVIGPYHAIGKIFEQDSLAGGLLGPVRIRKNS